MAMLRSAARFKHLWSAGDKQYVGCWESVPRRYGNALGPVSYANQCPRTGSSGEVESMDRKTVRS